MSSYMIALIDIHDRARYDRYLAGFDAVFEKYNGRVVAVEEQPRLLEGTWPARRTVMIRFPSDEEARRWYDSPEYGELMRHRHAAAVSNIVLVTGRD
jgi:uncharacterized protein (DUF1330 family)